MDHQSTGASRAAEWYAAGLFLVYAVLLFTHHSAPSLTDVGNWTYQGVLLREHLLGHADAFHALKHYPVPNSTATVGIGLLALLLPWKVALKVWLCLQLGFCFAAMRHLLRTVRAGWVSWIVMPQAVFLNVNFWYGFLNFELGVACVLLVGSMLLRRVRGAAGTGWGLSAVLLLAFFTHMLAFAFCGLLVLLYAAQTKRWRVLWQLAPATALSFWYLIGRFLYAGDADGQAGMEASVKNYSAAFWAFKGNSYLKSFGFVNPDAIDFTLLGRVGYLLLFAVNLLVGGVLLYALVKAAQKALRLRGEGRFLWLGILLVLPLWLLAPGAALGVSDPGARLLQLALALGLAMVGNEVRLSARVVAGGALVLTFFGLFLFAGFGFSPHYQAHRAPTLPSRMLEFGHVPNNDQDYFYADLDAGDLREKVFPTGLFLNRID